VAADPKAALAALTTGFAGRSVAVAIPDGTRSIDVPAALAALASWLPSPTQVTVVVGLGLHRPMTDRELAPIRAACPWRVLNHDPDNTVDLGIVSGFPCHVHPAFVGVDLVATVGQIELHQYAGLSGGHKGVAVGCGGRATLAALHTRAMVCDPKVVVGRLRNNPFRTQIDRLGRRIGCRLALQSIPSGQWLAGHPDSILERAAGLLNPWEIVPEPVQSCLLRVPRTKAANFYQASRAATYLALSPNPPLVPGARLVLDAECPEGVGYGSGELAFGTLLEHTPAPWTRLLTGPVPSGAGLQRAFMLARLRQRYELVVAGCSTAKQLQGLGIDATEMPADRVAGPNALLVEAPFSRLPQLRVCD
jgi:hypothetical protein